MPIPIFDPVRRWSPAALLFLWGCLGDFANPVNRDGVRIEFQPGDTAVYSGSAYQAHAKMRNEYGDLYPSEHIEYAALDQMVSVSRGGRVTAGALGRAGVIATRGDLADTGWVSIVPEGTLAVSLFSEQSFVDIVDLDGSEFHRIAPSGQFGGGAPAWLPSGTGLIYQEAIPGGAGASILYRTDLAGNRALLLPPGPASDRDQKYPRVSRDGVWVYFRLGSEIWRSHPDGTGLEQVTDAEASPGQDTHPDPSPDGARLLFTSSRFTQGELEIVVRDLASGEEQSLGVNGLLPRWSPAGDRIAYWGGDPFDRGGSIFVMQSDGTQARMVTPASRLYLMEGLDWSADGEWLVARAEENLELIHVATGLILPLGYTGANGWASWKR
jgi:Tol biopolymer transport system component